jgi:hypothetical protein
MVLFLLRWSHTRRDRDLHAAVACAALALGNHLTIVAVAPAAIAFTLLTDWRAVVRPRTLLINAALGVAGMAQYGYIIVRTLQHGSFLESRASTVAELVPIVAAQRFSKDVFSFSWTALLTERLPGLLGPVLGELGWCGAALVVGGLALLSRRDWRKAVLMAGGAAGALYLALNVAADVKGFLMPVFTLAWPAAALGIDGLAATLGRAERLRPMVAAGAAVLLPAGLVNANFHANDASGHTGTARYFDAIFASLPARAAFIAEEYTTDAVMTYQSIVRADTGRQLRLGLLPYADVVRRMKQSAFTVFAFRRGAGAMLTQGLEVSRVVVHGPDVRSVLDAFPPDHVIIIAAAGPGLPLSFAPPARRSAGWQAAGRRRHHVVLGRPGRWDWAVFESRNEPFAIGFAAGTAPRPIGGTLPRDIHVNAGSKRVTVVVGGHEVVRAEPGVAVAVLAPDGSIAFRQAWPPGVPLDTVLDTQQPALFRVGEPMACTPLGDRAWRDVTTDIAPSSIVLLRVDNAKPADGEFLVYAAADTPFAPVFSGEVESASPRLDVRTYDMRGAAAKAALREDLRRDAVTVPFEGSDDNYAARIEVWLPDGGDGAAGRLSFGTDVRRAIAHAVADRPALQRAAACTAPWPPVIGQWTATSGEVWLGPAAAEYFGVGWRGAERDAASDRAMRWTADLRARLRVPMPPPATTRVQLTVEPAPGVTTLAVEVNSTRMAPLPLRAGRQEVEWQVPADAWRAGVNDVWLVAGGTSREPGRAVHVTRIRLEHGE